MAWGITGMKSVPPNEDDTIRRAQAGEQAAFQQLAEWHVEPLCRCAFALCRDRQTAEDLAQETLVEAWRSLVRFDGRCQFSTWLYGILRHRFLKHVRRSANRSLLLLTEQQTREMPAASHGPEQLLQQAEEAAQIQRIVALLPEEHRQVIELRFFAGARLEEIAVLLDIPLGTVKSRLHNGLEKLRQANFRLNLCPQPGQSLGKTL